MTISFVRIAKAALTAFILCAPSQAGILNEYSTRASYDAAVTAQTLEQFNRADGTLAFASGSTAITFGPVSLIGYYNDVSNNNSATLWIDASPSFAPAYDYGTGGVVAGGGSGIVGTGAYNTGLNINFSPSAGIRSVGFDFGAIWGDNPSVHPTSSVLRLLVYEGASVSSPIDLSPTAFPGLGFYGITTTTDITGIRLVINAPTNRSDPRAIVDNLSFGAIASGSGSGDPPSGGELPEPGTYVLCAAGLLVIAAVQRRSRWY